MIDIKKEQERGRKKDWIKKSNQTNQFNQTNQSVNWIS